MKGQSSAEMLILMGAIVIVVSSTLYLGASSNQATVITQAARDGAENAIAAIDAEYKSSIDVEGVTLDAGTITIQVTARNAAGSMGWENFSDNVVQKYIREGALRYIHNAVHGSFPGSAAPVITAYNTYDVAVEVGRVTK